MQKDETPYKSKAQSAKQRDWEKKKSSSSGMGTFTYPPLIKNVFRRLFVRL